MDFDTFCKHLRVPNWKGDRLELVKLAPTGYQKRVVDSLLNNKISICAKFRRGGFSTNSVAFALWNLLVNNKSTLFFTYKDREAIELQRMGRSMIESMCESARWFGTTSVYQALGKEIINRLNFNDHEIRTATQKIQFHSVGAMKGWAPDYLILDEIAFAPDMEQNWKAIWPMASTKAHTLIVSSLSGRGWFEKMWLDSLQNNNLATPIVVSYLECPLYWDAGFVKQMQDNLGPKAYRSEILCDPHVFDDKVKFKGKFQEADPVNRQGRMYPHEVMADAIATYCCKKLDKPLERAFKNTLVKTGLV